MTLAMLLFRISFYQLQSAYLVELIRSTGLLLSELHNATEQDMVQAAIAVLQREEKL